MMSREGKENMMGMMSEMMQGYKSGMVMEMMPKCLGMMLQNMPKNDRIAFTLKIVGNIMEYACVGMSDEEKKDFMAKVVEQITS